MVAWTPERVSARINRRKSTGRERGTYPFVSFYNIHQSQCKGRFLSANSLRLERQKNAQFHIFQSELCNMGYNPSLHPANALSHPTESICEEILEYFVVDVIPIEPNFVVVTCTLIVAETETNTPTRRPVLNSVLTLYSPLLSRKQLRKIRVHMNHVNRFAR